MKDYNKLALEMHEKLKGKLEINSKIKIKSKEDLSTAYTPGVAEPCREIYKNKEDVYKYPLKGNCVAVISDGYAVLDLGIPVMHDDQHGTSVVVLAGLINSLKVVKKSLEEVKIIINGSGAAGIATTKLLLKYGFKNIIVLDTEGIIYKGRKNLNRTKEE